MTPILIIHRMTTTAGEETAEATWAMGTQEKVHRVVDGLKEAKYFVIFKKSCNTVCRGKAEKKEKEAADSRWRH